MNAKLSPLHPAHRLPGVPHVISDWLLFALLAAVGLLASSAHADSPLELTISNIENADGTLMVQIMDSETAFGGEAPAIASLILPARVGSVSATIDALPPGDYAIRVMHDVDGDGQLKTNMVGMPKEPWGMSNNAAGRFGPPKWEDARFTLPAEEPQTINLR